jgi:serine/threonine-protein kinase HipA
VRRRHQEDLCQALGLTPDFKYQQPDWALPSYAALGQLLNEHVSRPGADRLAVAQATLFHYLVGNADAHAKNISLLHEEGGRVRLAPLYDVACTAAYPELHRDLALSIGDVFDPEQIGETEWDDLGIDLGLGGAAFRKRRRAFTGQVLAAGSSLREEALRDGWHDPVIDAILDVISQRARRVHAD